MSVRPDPDPPASVSTIRMRALKNISHRSSLLSACVPWKILANAHLSCLRFLSLMCLQHYSLHLSHCGADERPGAVASAWPQHEQATTRRPERPSTRRRNGADSPSHGQTSVAGPARVAPRRIWLPLPVVRALPPCRVAQPLPLARHLQE
jgi:hypothetical protein